MTRYEVELEIGKNIANLIAYHQIKRPAENDEAAKNRFTAYHNECFTPQKQKRQARKINFDRHDNEHTSRDIHPAFPVMSEECTEQEPDPDLVKPSGHDT